MRPASKNGISGIARLLPTDVMEVGAQLHLELTDAEARELLPAINGLLDAADGLQSVATADVTCRELSKRDPGTASNRLDDPWNAFIRICDVRGGSTGRLAGFRVGVKDNIDVAGVPTSNGSASKSHVPSADAVVVERILAEGGRIVGKLNMDDFGYGASGETSAFGTPLNPRDPSRSPGGSSGGSGSALASGAVEFALGVDQGGSARIPASFCGVVALKPTHGLVPTYGCTHIDHTLDTICPMARTVAGAATLLEVIAGEDWRDPQWVRGGPPESWTRGSERGIAGITVGVVAESIDEAFCAPDVIRNLRLAGEILQDGGATVLDLSVPVWSLGLPLLQALEAHLAGAMIASEGTGYGHLGQLDLGRVRAFAVARREQNQILSPYMKACMIFERYLHERHFNLPYAHLQNLRLRLRAEMDAALREVDLLLTPTTPGTAPPLIATDVIAGISRQILESLPRNTTPVNLSGHPALALPSGQDDAGLPTSIQIVARRLEDALALRAGEVVENALNSI